MKNDCDKQEELLHNGSLEKDRILLLGMCQVDILARSFPSQYKIDHILWESSTWSDFPKFNAGEYSAVIVAPTLRHIMTSVDSPLHGVGTNDILWPRLVFSNKIEEYFEACSALVAKKVNHFAEDSKTTPLIFLSFFEPRQNYIGHLFPRYSLDNPSYFVMKLNEQIELNVRMQTNSYFLDVNEILNAHGRRSIQDDYVNHLTHASYLIDSFVVKDGDAERTQKSRLPSEIYDAEESVHNLSQDICFRILDMLAIIRQQNQIKLIIVDLDDTLWRGIAAEEESPHLDMTEGWPLAFAEALLVFKARGGMLAICSKNDEAIIQSKFDMIMCHRMTFNDFVAVKINYDQKSVNIKQILSEVNILPANTLFIDDNPREIAEVLAELPDIQTLSADHYDWRRRILLATDTQVPRVSVESAHRTESVQASIQRARAKTSFSREEWLHSLALRQTHVVVESTSHANFQRTFELINKTNQFNTTGRRWTHVEASEFFDNGGLFLCASLQDKMVDNGLIGVAVILGERIEQMVLSCRVFGLGAEQAMTSVATAMILENHDHAVGVFHDTGRNFTCHDHFTKMGFSAVNGVFVTSVPIPYPTFITAAS
ncbi:MAG: HAD-IIIC family phosphatase [Formivibrio sp.]|nr:HAD-IIIC family phosphatase [Formivibrio sp.]